MKKQITWAVIVGFGGLIVLLLVASCTGAPAGTAVAQPGPQGAAGPQGPPGEVGPAGQAVYAPGEGIASEITDVSIGSDNVSVVTFTLADENGIPLSLDQVESVQFLIARIEADEETGLTRYVNYFTRQVEGAEFRLAGAAQQAELATATQPTFEAGEGEFVEVGPGEYTYTFGQELGEEYDPELTHVVGAVVVRVARSVVANPLFTFVPAGGEVEVTRLVSTTDTCNGCHNELALHGGNRREFGLCIMCHTDQNVDPESGNSLNMQVMIHKIHSGAGLPSVQAGDPYYIVGFRQNIFNFSAGIWPQDTRNCTTCHTGPDGANFQTAPNIAACTSCHDDVNPATGENHPGGEQEDGDCSNCHQPEGEEFDASIVGAHTIPLNSTQVTGLTLEIVSVEGAVPGESPVVTFKVTDTSGNAIAPADMAYLALTLAGPTSDYVNRVTETIFRAPSDTPPVVEEAGNGAYRYTFTYTLPADATGTYAVGMEGYVMQAVDGVEEEVRVAGFNPVAYVALDGGEPTPRRQVVDRELCNACHNDLALHGTIRQNTEYCVMCHNPMATDEARRPAEAMPPTSINFRVLIHRLHRGEEADQPLVVYGFGNNPINFGEVRFPGNLADCETCHLPGTNTLPLLAGIQPTTVTQDGRVVSVTLATRAICAGCHDSTAAAGHFELQTTADGLETCEICHGQGSEFAVEVIHR